MRPTAGSVFTGEKMMREGSGLLCSSPIGPCAPPFAHHTVFLLLLYLAVCLAVEEVADYSLINHIDLGKVFFGLFFVLVTLVMCGLFS